VGLPWSLPTQACITFEFTADRRLMNTQLVPSLSGLVPLSLIPVSGIFDLGLTVCCVSYVPLILAGTKGYDATAD